MRLHPPLSLSQKCVQFEELADTRPNSLGTAVRLMAALVAGQLTWGPARPLQPGVPGPSLLLVLVALATSLGMLLASAATSRTTSFVTSRRAALIAIVLAAVLVAHAASAARFFRGEFMRIPAAMRCASALAGDGPLLIRVHGCKATHAGAVAFLAALVSLIGVLLIGSHDVPF